MKTYDIRFTEQGMQDEKILFYHICEKVHAPLTAQRYISGLRKAILQLEYSAGVHPVDEDLSKVLGLKVYRIYYKQVAIIYTIEENLVYIHHIIPQKMVIF